LQCYKAKSGHLSAGGLWLDELVARWREGLPRLRPGDLLWRCRFGSSV